MEAFSALLALCDGNPPVNDGFPSQMPLTRSFEFSLICTWTNGWAYSRDADDLRRHDAHCDVIVMSPTVIHYSFGEYLHRMILSHDPFSITDDSNSHVDNYLDNNATKFKDLWLDFDLQRHVNVPAHWDGCTIDLFILWASYNTTLNKSVASYLITDHTFVVCQLSMLIGTMTLCNVNCDNDSYDQESLTHPRLHT